MAVKIEFTGYINKVRSYDWGIAYDIAHNQMQRKNDQWEVTGRDYFSVVGPEGTSFAENDMVFVRGTLKTKVFDKQDGSKGVALNVRAEHMEKVAGKGNAKPTAKPEPAVQQVWPDVAMIPDEAPF